MKNVSFIFLLFISLLSAKEFKTWQDLKFDSVKRQKYDFSCGTAALLTLFKYQYGEEKKRIVNYK